MPDLQEEQVELEGFDPHHNMLQSERLGTFIEGGWPSPSQSFLYLCNPQKLAQAGLEYYAHGAGRCVVCYCIVKELEPTSDPWICHANKNPECPLILIGKPTKPDDYTLKEFLRLIAYRRINYLETQFYEAKRECAKRIATLMRIEAEQAKRNKPPPPPLATDSSEYSTDSE